MIRVVKSVNRVKLLIKNDTLATDMQSNRHINGNTKTQQAKSEGQISCTKRMERIRDVGAYPKIQNHAYSMPCEERQTGLIMSAIKSCRLNCNQEQLLIVKNEKQLAERTARNRNQKTHRYVKKKTNREVCRHKKHKRLFLKIFQRRNQNYLQTFA